MKEQGHRHRVTFPVKTNPKVLSSPCRVDLSLPKGETKWRRMVSWLWTVLQNKANFSRDCSFLTMSYSALILS